MRKVETKEGKLLDKIVVVDADKGKMVGGENSYVKMIRALWTHKTPVKKPVKLLLSFIKLLTL